MKRLLNNEGSVELLFICTLLLFLYLFSFFFLKKKIILIKQRKIYVSTLCIQNTFNVTKKLIKTMEKLNMTIQNTTLLSSLFPFIPQAQILSMGVAQIRKMLKVMQQSAILLYEIKAIKLIQECKVTPNILLTPYRLTAGKLKRNLWGKALLRNDLSIYIINRDSLFSLKLKKQNSLILLQAQLN
ncbi:MAG: hypothetical protein ACI9QD_001230 [Thermoproteota archaeon]|jgi:hypothetical protein